MRFSRVPGTGLTLIAGALVAGGALAGCGSDATSTAAAGPAVSSASAAPSASAVSGTPSATAKASASASASSGGSARPAGGPVPAGFAASSVTFVSQDEGYVLGTAPCSRKPCTSILRTLDRGRTWRGLPAPKVSLGRPSGDGGGTGVWGIRFATPTTGFVYGHGLWETTDGGEHWAKVPGAPADVEDLEVSDGHLLAAETSCSSQGSCSGSLLQRPVNGGTFRKVPGVTTPTSPATGYNVAAMLADRKLLVTRDGGSTVARHQTPCETDYNAAASVAVTGPDSLALLCVGPAGAGSSDKAVYTSGDLGAHWAKGGSPSRAGDGGFMAGPASKLTVATSSGASEMYYSPDGGKSWDTSYQADDGGVGWTDLGFTTPSDGVVVHGAPLDDANSDHRPGQLLLTDNGGASWHPVSW